MPRPYDGGPAFPGAWTNTGDRNESAPDGEVCPPEWTHHMVGMTLRDYFAAAALPAVIQTYDSPTAHQYFGGGVNHDDMVTAAYQIADAMIAGRDK